MRFVEVPESWSAPPEPGSTERKCRVVMTSINIEVIARIVPNGVDECLLELTDRDGTITAKLPKASLLERIKNAPEL